MGDGFETRRRGRTEDDFIEVDGGGDGWREDVEGRDAVEEEAEGKEGMEEDGVVELGLDVRDEKLRRLHGTLKERLVQR